MLVAIFLVTGAASESAAESKAVKLIRIATGKTVYEFDTKECENEVFTLEYTHSVDLTPVRESYTVSSDGTIVVNDVLYERFGAGMQSTKPDVGYFEQDGELIELRGVNRSIDTYMLRVGSIANPTIMCAQKTITLLEYVPPGERILITTK